MSFFRWAIVFVAFFAFHPSTADAAYKAKVVSGGGKLSGKITFGGQVPEPTKIPIEKNPEICGDGSRVIREVTVDSSGGLQHAVVYFEKIKEGKDWSTPEKGWQLNQKTCTFMPWIQVVPNKSKLEVINHDPILHNIHTYELIGKVRVTMFNEAQPTQGYTFNKKIKMRRGNTMKVECDAHNFMHAYIKVLKNPYFAITAADGSYSIDQVPPGEYKVTVWHSTLGEVNKKVKIEGGKTAEISHQFKK